METINYDEIEDWRQFEELGAEYFRSVGEDPKNHVLSIDVRPSGAGPDGGKDMILEFLVPDFIRPAKRKWVVQLKFEKGSVSPESIGEANLPTLIHSHGADGYILIMRSRPTQKLVELFERLNETCKHKYRYEIWTGEQFRLRLMAAPPRIHKQFFPKYANFLASKEKKGGEQ